MGRWRGAKRVGVGNQGIRIAKNEKNVLSRFWRVLKIFGSRALKFSFQTPLSLKISSKRSSKGLRTFFFFFGV